MNGGAFNSMVRQSSECKMSVDMGDGIHSTTHMQALSSNSRKQKHVPPVKGMICLHFQEFIICREANTEHAMQEGSAICLLLFVVVRSACDATL